jgi:hypothetical protein
MQNDATTAISKADLHKIVKISNHEPEIVDFSKLSSEKPAKTEVAPTKISAGSNKKSGAKKEEKKEEAPAGH